MRRPVGFLLLLLTLLWLTRGTASAAALVAITTRVDQDGSAHVRFAFDAYPGRYQLLGEGPLHAVIELPDSRMSTEVRPPVGAIGAITAIIVERRGLGLRVRISLSTPLPVRVVGDATGLDVSVASKGSPAVEPASIPAPTATRPASDQVVELLALNFADVSEVVGVLVAGQQLPPNDNFSPQASQLNQPPSFAGSAYGGYSSPPLVQQITPTSGLGQQLSLGQRLSDEIAIDRRLNAVILTGSRATVDRLRAIIQTVDVPVPSVLLQASSSN